MSDQLGDRESFFNWNRSISLHGLGQRFAGTSSITR
jgi:hypothetical protein